MVTNSCVYLHFTHEAVGALGARHSPRPLLGGTNMHGSGVLRREIADVYSVVIARLDRAIQYSRDADD